MHALFVLLVPLLLALPLQPSGKCVLDEAHALSQDEFNRLENMCVAVDKDGAGQIEIVVTDDFRGDEKEEFANKLFHSWGIGHKGKNDGVLVVLSPKMRKWRIEVGYGLEGRLTDAQAAEIGRNDGVPSWKKAQWGAGLISVVGTIAPMMYVEAKAVQPDPPTAKTTPTSPWTILWMLLVPCVAIAIFIFVMRRVEERRREEEALAERLRLEEERKREIRSQAKVLSFHENQYRSGVAPRTVTPRPAPVPEPTPVPVPVVVVEEHHHRRRDDTPAPSSSSSSDSSSSFDSGFSGGGGGDSGGGGAGGDF